MRFISPRIHGFLDYAVAAGLITAPLALDFAAVSPLAAVISIVAGLGLVAYSLLTDYSVSVRDLIPWRVHLTLDTVAAVALLLAPFALGFDGIPRAFYVTVALAVLVVVATSQLETDTEAVAAAEPTVGGASA